jgi:hypothetical protein
MAPMPTSTMAKEYLDQDRYPFRQPDEVRVIVQVTPTAKRHFG